MHMDHYLSYIKFGRMKLYLLIIFGKVYNHLSHEFLFEVQISESRYTSMAV